MRKPTLTRAVRAAVTILTGLGAVVLLLLLLGTWTGSATAAPSASRSPAPLLDAAAGITLVKTTPAVVNQALGAGQTPIPYTLTLQNPNGYAISGATVTDAVPTNISLYSGSPGEGWFYATSGGTVAIFDEEMGITLTATDIDVGTYYAWLDVPAKDKSIVVNTNYCLSGTVNSMTRSFCENIPVTTTIRAPDFSLSENSSTPICAGGRVTYTLTVTNPGGVETTQNFTITGQITPALNVATDTLSDGGVWNPNAITWTVTSPDLSADGANAVTRTFAVTVPTDTPHGALLTNTYIVTSPEVLPNVPSWQSSSVRVTRLTAAFTSTAPVCHNNQVAFQNNSTGATSYQWNFGDSSPISSEINPTHPYASPGNYTVILTATGVCGTDVETGTVTVHPLPIPVLQIMPDPTQLGVTTHFTDTGSGGANWDWSFGDGVAALTSVFSTTHVYTGTPRVADVVLTSTATTGCYSITSRSLQVQPGAPYTVTLSAWPLQPVVGASSAITAHVTDQWGNHVLNGTVITFTTPPPAFIAPLTNLTSGGLAHAAVTSTLAGPVVITGATPNGVLGTAVVTFTPELPYTVTLAAAPLILPVGNGAALTATVVDRYHNPISGQAMTLSTASALGSGIIEPSVVFADGQGHAYSTITSTVSGAKNLAATATNGVSGTAIVTFTAGAPYTITLTVNPLTLTVGNSAALMATVTDRFNNLIVGEAISFATGNSLGLGNIAPVTDTTNGAGEAHSSVMSTDAGAKTIKASAFNLVSATVVVNFQPGLPGQITLAAVPLTQTVGLSSQLRAQVRDQYLNVVPGEVISFTTSDVLGLGSLSPIANATDSSGWAFSDIMSTLPGPKRVIASTSNLFTATTVVTFFASSPNSLTLAAFPASLEVGNTAALTATLTDQYNNPLSGYTISLTTTDPLGSGALTPLSGMTSVAGQVASAISSTLPGVKTITALQSGLTATAQVNFTLSGPFTVTLVGAPDTLTAGQNAVLTATVADRFGNPIASDVVSFSASGLGSGHTTPPWRLTDSQGQAWATISSTVAGPHVILAQELTNNITGTTIITWTSGPAASLSLVANPTNLSVGNTSNLTTTLTDQYGNPLAGQAISFTAGSPVGSGSLAPITSTTDAIGQAHSAISSTIAGPEPVIATAPTGLTGTVTIIFSPGLPYTVTLTAAPPTLTVGNSAALTATVVDQYANPTPGQVVTFTHGGMLGLGGLAPLANVTDAAGQATSVISSTLVGPVPLTATVASGTSGTTSVAFVASAPSTLTLAVNPANLPVGNTAVLTATLTDQYSNPLSGYTVNWATTDLLGVGGLSPLSNATNATGKATSFISSTVIGWKTITTTCNGLTATTQVQFTPGAPTTMALVANPNTLPVGNTSALTATLTDQYGNPIASRWVAFTSSGDLPNPAGGLTDNNGRAASSISSGVIGTVAVTATDFLSPSVRGSTVVTFTGCTPVSGADFTWNPTTPTALQTVTFTGSVAGGNAPITYTFNWNDGTPQATGNPTFHTFNVSNTYTVLMTATNACGWVTGTRVITITGLPFTPTYGVLLDPPAAMQSAVPGATVNYVLTLTNTGNVAESFDLAQVIAGQAWATTVTPTRTATLPPNGAASVTVSVLISTTATSGQQSIATLTASSVTSPTVSDSSVLTTTAIISCISPTITALTSDSPVQQGQTMHLTATVTGDTPITYTWNFGDGTLPVTGIGLTNTNHVYSAIGNLTVTLAVANSCGASSRALAVRVNAPPGEPDHITLVATPASLPVSNTSSLTATVYNVSDALMAGQVVTFTTGDPLGSGALILLTATTNVQGQATAVISSTLTGIKRITVTAYNAVAASTNVSFYSNRYLVYLPLVMRNYAGPSLTLTANSWALMVGDTTTLTATAFDGLGAPVTGLTVTWSTTDSLGSGALTPFGATTDTGGQITATLRSTVAGPVRVTAQASNGSSASISLYFRGADFCAPQVWYTIPSASGPMGLAYEAARDRLFVAHRDSHSLAAIGAHSGQIIRTVTGLPGAQGVAFDAGRNRAYVIGGDILYIVDAASYSKLASIRLGTDVGAHAVAYHPTADKIYVTGYLDNSIKIVDAATGTVITKLIGPQISEPAFIAVNPVTNKVYVSNHNGGLPFSWVTVIDGNTNAILGSISLGGDLYGITADSVHNRVYVASISAARVYAIDGTSDTPIGDIQIVRAQDGRPVPLRMVAVNPSAGSDTHLWLTSSPNDFWGADRLILLSGNWPAMGQPRAASVAPSPEGGLMFDPASWFVFVSSPQSNLVSVSLDSTSLCPTPLSLGAGAERVFTIVHEYEHP